MDVRLDAPGPLAWDAVLEFLRARAIFGVESVEGGAYARVVRAGDHVGMVRVERDGPALRVELDRALEPALATVLTQLRALFDLEADAGAIDRHLARDPLLAIGVSARPGLRVPGTTDPFELVVRAVAGQRVSVAAARRFVSRIAERFGDPLAGSEPTLRFGFPTAARIARADPSEIGVLGLTRARARTLVEAARAVDAGHLVLAPGAPVEVTMAALQELDGVGPWTAAYIAMRALRWRDAFLPTDLGVRHALPDLSPRELIARADAWRPWRAYAVLHLWTRGPVARRHA